MNQKVIPLADERQLRQRPYSNLIWRGFTPAERKRARRYMHMWNVCRRRIPAEMHQLVSGLEQNQILVRREAAVKSVETMGSSLVCRTSAGVFEAQIVMNCMGYDYRIDPQAGGMLPALAREGLIGLEDGFPVPVDDTCRLHPELPALWCRALVAGIHDREHRRAGNTFSGLRNRGIPALRPLDVKKY